MRSARIGEEEGKTYARIGEEEGKTYARIGGEESAHACAVHA